MHIEMYLEGELYSVVQTTILNLAFVFYSVLHMAKFLFFMEEVFFLFVVCFLSFLSFFSGDNQTCPPVNE